MSNRRSLGVAIATALSGMVLGMPAAQARGLCDAPSGSGVARIDVRGADDADFADRLGRVLGDYGHYRVVATEPGALRYAKATRPWAPAAAMLPSDIALRGLRFDPAQPLPPAMAAACRELAGKQGEAVAGTYVVQFDAPATDAHRAAVRAAGGRILQYVPHRAFLVSATPAALQRILGQPGVRWAGPLPARGKVRRELAWAAEGDKASADARLPGPPPGPAIYDVAVFAGADVAAVRRHATGPLQGELLREIRVSGNFFEVLRMRLAPAAVSALLRLPDVFAIDPWVPPTREDERAAQIVAGNYTGRTLADLAGPGYDPGTQFGVTGSGVTVGVVDDGVGIPGDGGFYVTASNTVNGPLRGAAAGADGHGHLQASIIAGTTPYSTTLDPAGYNYGLGIAPGAHVVNIPMLRADYSGSEIDAQQDLAITAGPNGVPAQISNNSWGAGTNGNAYDTLAAQFDAVVRDASTAAGVDPLIVVFSAGNQGDLGLTRPKVAKNVIAVAASENLRAHLDPTADDMDQIADFSSRGLAADGRVKPDVAAPGQAVSGGRAGPSALFGNIDTVHRWSSGTSHAAPQVAGALALFVESLAQAGATPSPAMAKAALINAAVDMAGDTTTAVPNGDEGWGRVHLERMLNPGVPVIREDAPVTFTAPGDSATYTGVVADASVPVRVTLAWADPPGAADPARVNDLDLEVTVGGTLYRGNVFANGQSVSGGSADAVDTVENVFLPPGLSGPVAVTVRASELNGDGVLDNGDATDQDFALVIGNVVAAATAVTALEPAVPVAGSCVPDNGVIDPGERVTLDLGARNVGTVNGETVTVSLQASADVIAPTPGADYGVLPAGGMAEVRQHTFTAGAVACGAPLTLSMALGGNGGGTVTQQLPTGTIASGPPASGATADPIAIDVPGPGNVTTPYPSTLTIDPTDATVAKVTVTLQDVTHTWPDDIDVLLQGPDGTAVVLMSDAGGGTPVMGVDLVFDDDAVTALPDGPMLAGGTYRPTNHDGEADTFGPPAPPSGWGSSLSAFEGTGAAGEWRLFVSDGFGNLDEGTIGGWSIAISTIDPPICASNCSAPDVAAATGLTVRAGDLPVDVAVASVSDAETPAAALAVTLGAVPAVLQVGAPSNTDGTVVASIGTPCGAPVGATAFGLVVDDNDGLQTNAAIPVAIAANLAPSLGSYADLTLPAGAGASVPSDAPPADSSGIAAVTVSAPGFGGDLAVNPTTGEVTIANAGPVSTTPYTVTVQATDTCGNGASTGFQLAVPPPTTVSVSAGDVLEGDGGGASLPFTVTRDVAVGALSVQLSTIAGGSAAAGADYTAIAGTTVAFAHGESTQVVEVPVIGDLVPELDETVRVAISDPTNGATIGVAQAEGTIRDDDPWATAVLIESDEPDPSAINAPYLVTTRVTSAAALPPAGSVVVSDGRDSCGPVPVVNGLASCTLTSTTGGEKTLTATFTPADDGFTASAATASHSVPIPPGIFADGFEAAPSD